MTVQVPSIKFAEPKPLIGAAFHFSIPQAGAPRTWAQAHFPFVCFIWEEENGQRGRGRLWERRAGEQRKGGRESRGSRQGALLCPQQSVRSEGTPPAKPVSPPDISSNPGVADLLD